MPKNHIAIRTCICCRGKFDQKDLNRLKCEDKKIIEYNHIGRSFYVCNECLSAEDNKSLNRALFRECKNKDDYILQLKEILENVR